MKLPVLLVGMLLAAAGASLALADEPEIDLSGIDPGTETASHRELAPLDVEFERLTAVRLHPRGSLLACDGDARQIKVIDAAGKVGPKFPHKGPVVFSLAIGRSGIYGKISVVISFLKIMEYLSAPTTRSLTPLTRRQVFTVIVGG